MPTFISLTELFAFQGFIIMSASAALFAFLLANSKTRYQQQYQILAGCACFNIFFGMAYLSSGLYHLLKDDYNEKMVPRLKCLNTFHAWLFTFITPMSGFITLTTSLDRAFFVLYPCKYLKLGTWYTVAIFLAPVPFPVSCLIYSYIRAFMLRNIPNAIDNCLLQQSVPPVVYLIMRIARIIATFFGVVVYIPVVNQAIKIIERNRRTSLMARNYNAGRRQMRQLSITVGLTTLNEFLMFAVPDTYLLIRGVPGWHWAFLLTLNKGFLDLVIVFVTQHELRSIIIASLKRQNTTVHQIAIISQKKPSSK